MSFPFAAILLDFDGTLVDTESVKMRALTAFMLQQGVRNFVRNSGDSSSQIIRDVFSPKIGPLKAEALAVEFQFYQAKFMGQQLKDEDIAYSDVIPFLRQLETLKITKTIVTTSNRQVLNVMGGRAGILDFFDSNLIVTKNDVPPGKEKPDPTPYLLAAEKLGVRAKDCLALEDSETGINSALSAGCSVGIVNREANNFDAFSVLWEVQDLDAVQRKLGFLMLPV